jgi:hypothetical protein
MPGNLGRMTADMRYPGNVQAPQPPRYVISGVTRDTAGNPLGGCTVRVFEKMGLLRAEVVSDANGNYRVDVNGPDAIDAESGELLTFQCVAYLPSSPDQAGVTVNTLVGVPA